MKSDFPPDQDITFTCNICGHRNTLAAGRFHREMPSCEGCSSTPRFRGIVHALALGLWPSNAARRKTVRMFGRSSVKPSMPLRKFPDDRAVKGIGMSEWDGYAAALAEKYDFTNTFFHQAPMLDIVSDSDWQNYRDNDFVICTEVFEHVLQPLEPGFRNLRRMLKTGGHLVFSTPFVDAPETIEHFPGMVDFCTCQVGDDWVVVSKQADGSYDVFDDNVHFHGGPGTVLEMRIFGRQALIRQLEAAGFSVRVLDEAVPEIGYYWPSTTERPEVGLPGENYIMLCKAV